MSGLTVVRAGEARATRQGLAAFAGVAGEGLCLQLVVVPPGAVSEPHYHDGFETAIYQLSGRVETRYGERLEESVVTEPGDFLYVPPGLPHQARNLSDTEPATALVARDVADEQERIVLVDVQASSSL